MQIAERFTPAMLANTVCVTSANFSLRTASAVFYAFLAAFLLFYVILTPLFNFNKCKFNYCLILTRTWHTNDKRQGAPTNCTQPPPSDSTFLQLIEYRLLLKVIKNVKCKSKKQSLKVFAYINEFSYFFKTRLIQKYFFITFLHLHLHFDLWIYIYI